MKIGRQDQRSSAISTSNQDTILVPYRMLGGVLALYVCFGCAFSLSKRYGLDPLSNALGSVATYLVALGPVKFWASIVNAPPK